MKRVISCLMALVMLVSALPVVPAEAATPVTMSETALGLSDDSSFGRRLNNSLPAEEPAEEELESQIHALDFRGKTASVILTVPRASRLVVAIYDETTDAMFASGTLDVVPGEEQQEVTVQIEIDTMPEYFRGKAFLLDKNTNVPLSQIFQYEKFTQGYQEISNTKLADFLEKPVYSIPTCWSTSLTSSAGRSCACGPT